MEPSQNNYATMNTAAGAARLTENTCHIVTQPGSS